MHAQSLQLCLTLSKLMDSEDYQAPLSMRFPDKNTGVGCHDLFQGIFLTQESNIRFLNCRRILYH